MHSQIETESNIIGKRTKTWTRGRFNTYPQHPLKAGTLHAGYADLADRIGSRILHGLRVLSIDGFHGVNWEVFRAELEMALNNSPITKDTRITWVSIDQSLKSEDQLATELAPFLGGDDPIFGHIWPVGIDSFFEPIRLAGIRSGTAIARGQAAGALTIIYGTGSGLIDISDELWYVDVSKEYIQKVQKAGKLTNWGTSTNLPFGAFYKRAYYVEWPALNRHKHTILHRIDCMIDLHDSSNPVSISGSDLKGALDELTRTPFRPRPWFAAGPWGGQFMKGHMGLDPVEPNYAWSFELIAPENGVVLGDGQHSLEITFDCLLMNDSAGVMGTDAARQFGTEWPVRFDYLDTIQGGNLSVQVHPRPDYIRREFGETFTQDETYYIAKATDGAKVYLGFTDETDPDTFREILETSAREGIEVDVDRYVHHMPAKDHDLFMIPNGTIHCSGEGNLVLEISATPYIYTFKLYDYLRRDLNGNLRPINIDRGFENLYWDRRSDWVNENLVAKPRLLSSGTNWQEWVLMDIPQTFYCIHRVDFETSCEWETNEIGYMVNLVAGDDVEVHVDSGAVVKLAYLESMVIPARAGNVRFVNKGQEPCKLMKVFVRPGTGITEPLNNPTG